MSLKRPRDCESDCAVLAQSYKKTCSAWQSSLGSVPEPISRFDLHIPLCASNLYATDTTIRNVPLHCNNRNSSLTLAATQVSMASTKPTLGVSGSFAPMMIDDQMMEDVPSTCPSSMDRLPASSAPCDGPPTTNSLPNQHGNIKLETEVTSNSTEQYSRQTIEDLMRQAALLVPSCQRRSALVMGSCATNESCHCQSSSGRPHQNGVCA